MMCHFARGSSSPRDDLRDGKTPLRGGHCATRRACSRQNQRDERRAVLARSTRGVSTGRLEKELRWQRFFCCGWLTEPRSEGAAALCRSLGTALKPRLRDIGLAFACRVGGFRHKQGQARMVGGTPSPLRLAWQKTVSLATYFAQAKVTRCRLFVGITAQAWHAFRSRQQSGGTSFFTPRARCSHLSACMRCLSRRSS